MLVSLSLYFFPFSLFHDPDEGHKEFLVEVFENQSRSFPGGDFKPAEQNWTDPVRQHFSLALLVFVDVNLDDDVGG